MNRQIFCLVASIRRHQNKLDPCEHSKVRILNVANAMSQRQIQAIKFLYCIYNVPKIRVGTIVDFPSQIHFFQ